MGYFKVSDVKQWSLCYSKRSLARGSIIVSQHRTLSSLSRFAVTEHRKYKRLDWPDLIPSNFEVKLSPLASGSGELCFCFGFLAYWYNLGIYKDHIHQEICTCTWYDTSWMRNLFYPFLITEAWISFYSGDNSQFFCHYKRCYKTIR